VLAPGVEGSAQELEVADAGDFDRVLEGEEEAGEGAFFHFQVEQVYTVEQDFACGDFEGVVAGEDLGQGAFAGAVGAHDGVDFAGFYLEVDALEYGGAFYGGMEVLMLSICWCSLSVRF